MTLTKPKTTRNTPHNRKRVGAHHAHNHGYVKTYWPYLPVFAVLGLGVFVNSLLSHANHSVLGYATDISSQVLLQETNGERTGAHLPALQLNSQLTSAAQAKAADMANKGYWAHVSPSGEQPWAFVTAAGYNYEAAGENLAYGFGTSDDVMNAWMHSPEHRANIMDSVYQDVGFATVNIADYQGHGPATLVVAEYGEPAGMVNSAVHGATDLPAVLGSAQSVSRLQVLTPSTIAALVLAALCGAALAIFFARHALAWHKVLVRGEHFAMHHPLVDAWLMGIIVLVFTLGRSAGSIL